MTLNLDITFPKIPCDVLSLDIEDELGFGLTNFQSIHFKKRIGKDGNLLDIYNLFESFEGKSEIQEHVKEYLKEG